MQDNVKLSQNTQICVHCNSNMHVKNYVVWHDDPPKPFYICKKCGVIFEDPSLHFGTERFDFEKPIESLTEDDIKTFRKIYVEAIDISDNSGNLYPNFAYHDPNEMVNALFERVNPNIQKFLSPERQEKLTVLEVGCATGFLLKKFKSVYPQSNVLGIDPSPISCEKAKKNNVNVLCGTLDTIDLKDHGFDIVICIGNLMLHENPFNTLLTIKKHLKHDGILIFDVKNPGTLIRRIAKIVHSNRFLHTTRVVKYLRRATYINMRYAFFKHVLRQILDDMGFEILRMCTKPPRLLMCPNDYPGTRGISGIIWRFTDMLDKLLDQRAWIECCCRIK